MSEETPEIWRSYLGDYLVSTKGRVRHIDAKKPRVLSINMNGYPVWSFNLNGKQVLRTVHRAVLETFVGPAPRGHVARHLNGIATDCRLENLAWGTQSENRADAERHGTIARGAMIGSAKLTEELVREIRRSSEPGTVIAKRLKVTKECVSAVRRRITWKWVDDAG